MKARLLVSESAYVLSSPGAAGWEELAVLAGAGDALLPPGRPVDPAALEAAIERSEDWVMPQAARLAGAQLEVVDRTGRLAADLLEVFATSERRWDTESIESLFNALDFMAARPRLAAALRERRGLVAAIVLLRELAHHAKLQSLALAE